MQIFKKIPLHSFLTSLYISLSTYDSKNLSQPNKAGVLGNDAERPIQPSISAIDGSDYSDLNPSNGRLDF